MSAGGVGRCACATVVSESSVLARSSSVTRPSTSGTLPAYVKSSLLLRPRHWPSRAVGSEEASASRCRSNEERQTCNSRSEFYAPETSAT